MPSNDPKAKTRSARRDCLAPVLLAVVLAVLFALSFHPDYVVASNDGPLGGIMSDLNRMPDILTGIWADLNWLGTPGVSPAPTVSTVLRLVTTPVGWAKLYAPFSLFFVGIAAWICFRRFHLGRLASTLGAIAVTLNSNFFSSACWGVCSHPITFGACFFALAALANGTQRAGWGGVILAGLAVGVNVMEGYDIGAIFSLFVASFVLYQALISQGTVARNLASGSARIAVVALFAAFVAAHTLTSLIGTQIKGVAGTEQTPEAKAQRWDFATQWSFPKGELLRLAIAGLFGYRMDTPTDMEAFSSWFEGGAYWGKAGETPGWSEHHNDPEWARIHPGAYPRFSGGGEYAGVLVLAAALWAVVQSFREKNPVYSVTQRKLIWFWLGAAVVSLLLAFGRYAPFYQLFYLLPYVSTIRNPSKFMHTLHWCLLILFAYGVYGLERRYLATSTANVALGLQAHLKTWWARADDFEKKWTTRSVLVIIASLLGWLVYSASRATLEKHLQDIGFADPATARQVAGFSIAEVGWFILFLILTVGLLTLILSGRFAGSRAHIAGVCLGVLLVIDLSRANLPWIVYWNYPEKYASNPLIDKLRDKPYEKRVAMFPLERFLRPDRLPPEARMLFQVYQQLNGVYRVEWMQQQFQYYNIQCLDIVQMPREPVDLLAYEGALSPNPLRRWELTNTRYLFAPTAMLEPLNQQIDPAQKRFRILSQFEIEPKPGVANPTSYEQLTAVPSTNGPCALFEFSGTLPRAKLYTHWLAETNDQSTLTNLASPSFVPADTVLVANPLPPSSPRMETNQNPGSLEFVSYAPKKLQFRATTVASSVLLLNDHFDPNWKVSVDGKPETLLRCNYLMQGVAVPAGKHEIEFRFQPPLNSLWISIAGIVVSLVLAGVLTLVPRRVDEQVLRPVATSPPAKKIERAGKTNLI
jgi:hypothetical protein